MKFNMFNLHYQDPYELTKEPASFKDDLLQGIANLLVDDCIVADGRFKQGLWPEYMATLHYFVIRKALFALHCIDAGHDPQVLRDITAETEKMLTTEMIEAQEEVDESPHYVSEEEEEAEDHAVLAYTAVCQLERELKVRADRAARMLCPLCGAKVSPEKRLTQLLVKGKEAHD